jgi:nitrogen fixation NifU-like protein
MGGLYQERFLDHYRNPRNRGELDSPDISSRVDNPLCGDTVRLDVRLDEKQRVSEVKFSGEGCVVCIASASILTEELGGKTVDGLKELDETALLDLLGVALGSVRAKCALLPLRALQQGLAEWERSG